MLDHMPSRDDDVLGRVCDPGQRPGELRSVRDGLPVGGCVRQRRLRLGVSDRPDRLQRHLRDVVERPESLRLVHHGLPLGNHVRERDLRLPERDVAV
jgi:hypothetical protein